MKWVQTILFFSLICCNTPFVSAQNITVDDSFTAQQLVEDVLINNSCATVSNYSATGDTFPVGQNSYGYNDVWKIRNLDLFPSAIITIYDHYGKLML